jgi:hypothetical protein
MRPKCDLGGRSSVDDRSRRSPEPGCFWVAEGLVSYSTLADLRDHCLVVSASALALLRGMTWPLRQPMQSLHALPLSSTR